MLFITKIRYETKLMDFLTVTDVFVCIYTGGNCTDTFLASQTFHRLHYRIFSGKTNPAEIVLYL